MPQLKRWFLGKNCRRSLAWQSIVRLSNLQPRAEYPQWRVSCLVLVSCVYIFEGILYTVSATKRRSIYAQPQANSELMQRAKTQMQFSHNQKWFEQRLKYQGTGKALYLVLCNIMFCQTMHKDLDSQSTSKTRYKSVVKSPSNLEEVYPLLTKNCITHYLMRKNMKGLYM